MQDRYAGDVGDFVKLGLLRALCRDNGTSKLRLGINWYLTPDESHNSDGKHTGYLAEASSRDRALRLCDPDLFDRLRILVQADNRSVLNLQLCGALPEDTLTHSDPLLSLRSGDQRTTWHKSALNALSQADLIFADPDNGISDNPKGSKANKYALVDELSDYTTRNQSIVVYHHGDRSAGGARRQLERRLSQLYDVTGIRPLGGVVSHRGSCRFFLVVAVPQHQEHLFKELVRHHANWNPHAEFVGFS